MPWRCGRTYFLQQSSRLSLALAAAADRTNPRYTLPVAAAVVVVFVVVAVVVVAVVVVVLDGVSLLLLVL